MKSSSELALNSAGKCSFVFVTAFRLEMEPPAGSQTSFLFFQRLIEKLGRETTVSFEFRRRSTERSFCRFSVTFWDH